MPTHKQILEITITPSWASSASRVTIVGRPPFIGLDRLLKRAGLTRDLFEITPLGDYQSGSENAILALGEDALRFLVGEANILRWSGRVARGLEGKWIIPTLHPFFDLLPRKGMENTALRNPARFVGAGIFHLRKALNVAKNGFQRIQPRYLCDPSPEEFGLWVIEFENALAREDVMLSWDIETPYKLKKSDEDEFEESERDTVILRISFAYREGTGVSVPWTPQYLPSIRRLLSSRGVHVVWNGDAFDVPLVRGQGIEVNGEVHDYMWGWHTYQSDLPMGLEFVSSFWGDLLPWKHLNNADPALYSAIDADAALRNAIGIRDALKRTGQWELFKAHVVTLDPILYDAGINGSAIDIEKQNQLREELTGIRKNLIWQAQTLVPENLKPRKRYKKTPKIAPGECRTFEEVRASGSVKACDRCNELITSKTAHQKGKKNPCKGAGVVKGHGSVIEWDEILPFNPNSTDQIKNYIRHFNHPMGANKKDREKEAADSRHLEKLAKKCPDHPIYALTIQIHKVSKALSTYVEGFRPDALGLIHTTYTHAPSTGRLSSRNVNLQNVGKRGGNKWAKDARKQIVARPGHVFVQGDSSAIEAVLVGHFMGSAEYVDMARKGIHARLACYKLGLEFSDANKALIKEDHPNLYDQCKITVHGTSFGMAPKLMTELFPDLFPTIPEAAEFQNAFIAMVPGLKKWQHATRVRAHKETFLENPWGWRHYFYDVFSQNSYGDVKPGADANRAIAFLPQSSAGCFMKDSLLILGKSWAREFIPAHVTVHDSICLDVPEERAEDAAQLLEDILSRPVPQLQGLRIGSEIEIGRRNWGGYDKDKNPDGMKLFKVVTV